MNAMLWKLAGPVKQRIAVSTGLSVLVTLCYVLQGISLALALGAVLRTGAASEAIRWIALCTVFVAVRAVLVWTTELAAQSTARTTKDSLRERLLRKLFALGPGHAAKRQTGDLQSTIVAGVEALETYYSRYLPAVLAAFIGCTGVIVFMASIDWRSAALLAFFVAALPIVDRLWLRWRLPTTSGVFAAMGAFGAYFLDTLQGIVTLKAFDATAGRRAELARRASALRRESMTTLLVTLMRTGQTGLITLGGIAAVLAFNAWRVAAGDLSPTVLFLTLFLAREAFRPLDRLDKEFHLAWAAASAAGPIAELLAAPIAVREPAVPVSAPSQGTLSFENVTFAYENSDAPALKSVSFSVRERELIALAGPSGAGKSTVVALLLRFFDPQSGVVRIGGVDVRQLSLADLRSMVSVVSQDTVLFHGSIEDNLRIARPSASVEEVREAARAANIHEFIGSLPQGYATQVGERGSQLSGGQRQRMAIARALLKNAPILLLDEATSSVDPASEQAIQEALELLAKRRTTLVIAHRLSTIRKADRILVVENGAIVETGSHDDLVTRRGLYSKLSFAEGARA